MQGFHAQRILEHRAPKQLGREIWYTGKGQILALGERVSDIDGSVVVQPDDVARKRLFRLAAVGRQESQCIGDTNLFVEAHVMHAHPAHVAAGTQPHEGNAVAMTGIHVRLNLEYESGELGFVRLDRTLQGRPRQWSRRVLDECAQQFSDTEIIDRGAEKHRCLPGGAVGLQVEGWAGAAYQVDFVAELGVARAQKFPGLIALETLDALVTAHPALLDRNVNVDFVLEQMINAPQIPSHADWPGDGRALDLEHALDFIKKFYGRAAVAIEFVHEGHDGRVA